MTEMCNSRDTSCQDGICPECNFHNYKAWLESHLHCDEGSWNCPDEEDCPHNRGYPISWVV